MREQDERDLRARLREEAERHQPDRAAMLERIVRTRAEQRRPALIRLRPLAAAAGVAAVLGVSIAGVRVASSDSSAEQVAAPTQAPSPAAPATSRPPAASASASQENSNEPPQESPDEPPQGESDTPTSSPSKAGHTPQASASSGISDRSKDGFLSADASLNPNPNPNWSENDLVLTATKTITKLDVSITVAKTDQLVSTGQWTSIPPEMMTTTTTDHGDEIVYRFVLKDGHTLAPGEYTFAAQYNHAAKRSIKADSYAASTWANKTPAEVTGSFRTP